MDPGLLTQAVLIFQQACAPWPALLVPIMESLLFDLILLAWSMTANAATYYVATTGSDANVCSQASPCATISKGGSLMAAGDTLYLRAGTYAQTIQNTYFPSGTSWANPVTIAGFPGETVTLAQPGAFRMISFESGTVKQYMIIDNFIIDALNGLNTDSDAVKFNPPHHHLRLQNSEIKNANQSGIFSGRGSDFNEYINLTVHNNGLNGPHGYAYGYYIESSNNLVDRNRIYDNTGYGLIFYYGGTGSPMPSNNVIRNSLVYNNSTAVVYYAGILLAKGDNNQAYNNVIRNNPYGIVAGYGATNSKIYNNTVYNNVNYGIQVGESLATSTTVKNNIVVGGSYILDDGTSTTCAYNLVNGGANIDSVCTNTVTASPAFTNAGAGNFTLIAGSAAINAGTATIVSGSLSILFNGSAPEIGAYEVVTLSQCNTQSANIVRCAFQNNTAPPLLFNGGTCTPSFFTIRQNAVGLTETACAINGQNEVNITVSETMTGGGGTIGAPQMGAGTGGGALQPVPVRSGAWGGRP